MFLLILARTLKTGQSNPNFTFHNVSINTISCLIGQNHSNSLETYIYCPIVGKCVLDKEAEAIPDWCPLMDLPEKDNGDYPANASDAGFVEGWNQCIDEITGG